MEKRCFSCLRALIVVSLNESAVSASVKRGTEPGFHAPSLPLPIKKANLCKIKEKTKKTNPIQKIPYNLINFPIALIEKNNNKRLSILWRSKGDV